MSELHNYRVNQGWAESRPTAEYNVFPAQTCIENVIN
jgi:hypothetical protein